MKIWDRNSICRVLFMSEFEISLTSFCALCKISDVKIFRRLPVFVQFQPNCMGSMAIKRECRLLLFLAIGHITKIWHFEIFVNTGPYAGTGGQKVQNAASPIQPFSSQLRQTLWGHWLPWPPTVANTGCYVFGNFTESMVIRGEYMLLVFGDLPNVRNGRYFGDKSPQLRCH